MHESTPWSPFSWLRHFKKKLNPHNNVKEINNVSLSFELSSRSFSLIRNSVNPSSCRDIISGGASLGVQLEILTSSVLRLLRFTLEKKQQKTSSLVRKVACFSSRSKFGRPETTNDDEKPFLINMKYQFKAVSQSRLTKKVDFRHSCPIKQEQSRARGGSGRQPGPKWTTIVGWGDITLKLILDFSVRMRFVIVVAEDERCAHACIGRHHRLGGQAGSRLLVGKRDGMKMMMMIVWWEGEEKRLFSMRWF